MLASAIPTKFPIPWGNSAGGAYIRPIPVASQIGVNPGYASLTDGFVPLNMAPEGAGGIPPFGQDMNGIINQITAWNQWNEAGGPIPYDGSFSASIGGYPAGAVINSAAGPGQYWVSLVDSNASDPDTGGDNWTSLGIASTGDWKWRPTSETLPGWVKANATTIGNASSGASQLAAASTAALFKWLWTNFSNTQCPVSGGRGVSSAADFAANKTIQVLDMRGIGIMGMDTMGGAATTRLNGVPATSGNATTAGSLLGENLHSMLAAENGSHNHLATVSDPSHSHSLGPLWLGNLAGSADPGAEAVATNIATNTSVQPSTTGISVSTVNNGSGTGHNTVQFSIIGTHYLKM